MSVLVEGVHTFEALSLQLERTRLVYPESLIVGTLGRAGVYNEVFDDPFVEYEARGQNPLTKYRGKSVGDIDIIGGPSEDECVGFGPFYMDIIAFGCSQMSITRKGTEWILGSSLHGYEEVIPPKALKPVKATTVYGAECMIPPAQTQLALLGLSGVDREQDIIARGIMEQAIQEGADDDVSSDDLAPFHELADLNRNSRFAQLRKFYRNTLPEPLRVKLSPAVQPIKKSIGIRL